MSAADRNSLGARERLLAAAITAIAEQGYAATSVSDVIARAGCGRTTLYQHFSDLEDCLVAGLDHAAGELLATLEHATRHVGGVDAARTVVSALVDCAREQQEPARAVLLEALGGGPRALARRDRLVAHVERLIDDRVTVARSGRQTLGLPGAALAGGTCRLLAIRLHGGDVDQEQLRSGLLAWIDSYLIPVSRSAAAAPAFSVIKPSADLRSSAVNPPPPLPRGRHPLNPAEVGRNQRERILHATIWAVYRYTYQATTVRDIITHAGVSERAFYRQFRDREHAATAALELCFEHFMAATARAFFAEAGWPQRVWGGALAATSFLAANPAMARLGFVEFHAISQAAIKQVYDRLNAWTLFLEEGYGYREQNRELPRLFSDAIAAAIFDFSYRAARQARAAAELARSVPVFAYVCLAPFLGPDGAIAFVQTKTRDAQRSDAEHRHAHGARSRGGGR